MLTCAFPAGAGAGADLKLLAGLQLTTKSAVKDFEAGWNRSRFRLQTYGMLTRFLGNADGPRPCKQLGVQSGLPSGPTTNTQHLCSPLMSLRRRCTIVVKDFEALGVVVALWSRRRAGCRLIASSNPTSARIRWRPCGVAWDAVPEP
jgi:hypothetical protein